MPQNALCSLSQLSHLLLSCSLSSDIHKKVYVDQSVCEKVCERKNYIRVEKWIQCEGKTQKTGEENQSGGTLRKQYGQLLKNALATF